MAYFNFLTQMYALDGLMGRLNTIGVSLLVVVVKSFATDAPSLVFSGECGHQDQFKEFRKHVQNWTQCWLSDEQIYYTAFEAPP